MDNELEIGLKLVLDYGQWRLETESGKWVNISSNSAFNEIILDIIHSTVDDLQDNADILLDYLDKNDPKRN